MNTPGAYWAALCSAICIGTRMDSAHGGDGMYRPSALQPQISGIPALWPYRSAAPHVECTGADHGQECAARSEGGHKLIRNG